MVIHFTIFFFFFFNDTATTEIYTLSLHDALPIFRGLPCTSRSTLGIASERGLMRSPRPAARIMAFIMRNQNVRSEEHTSELQSPCNLVCRLLLEKKKQTITSNKDQRRTCMPTA